MTKRWSAAALLGRSVKLVRNSNCSIGKRLEIEADESVREEIQSSLK